MEALLSALLSQTFCETFPANGIKGGFVSCLGKFDATKGLVYAFVAGGKVAE